MDQAAQARSVFSFFPVGTSRFSIAYSVDVGADQRQINATQGPTPAAFVRTRCGVGERQKTPMDRNHAFKFSGALAVELAHGFSKMKGRNIRGLCILLGCALHAGLEGKGQEAAFRSFVAEQVVLGIGCLLKENILSNTSSGKGGPLSPRRLQPF